MTEQQISQLKEILDKTGHKHKSPPELDNKIISTATRNLPSSNNINRVNWFSQTQLHYLGAGALSLFVTALIFITLGQLVTSTEEQYPLTATNELKLIDIETNNAPEKTDNRPRLGNVDLPTLTSIHNSERARDELLASIELPSVESLLNDMEFSILTDRSLAATRLTSALADINQMIKSGQLNDARDRYDRLRQNCNACQLPTTLEALAQLYPKSINRT